MVRSAGHGGKQFGAGLVHRRKDRPAQHRAALTAVGTTSSLAGLIRPTSAATIDGASAPTIFWRILYPLVAPGLVATSIFAFITAYNEFIIALTFPGQAHSAYTLPI